MILLWLQKFIYIILDLYFQDRYWHSMFSVIFLKYYDCTISYSVCYLMGLIFRGSESRYRRRKRRTSPNWQPMPSWAGQVTVITGILSGEPLYIPVYIYFALLYFWFLWIHVQNSVSFHIINFIYIRNALIRFRYI